MNSTSERAAATAGLAKATIQQIDNLPDRTPGNVERAKHKFNMIRIAERVAAEIPVDDVAANNEIVAACEWVERQAA